MQQRFFTLFDTWWRTLEAIAKGIDNIVNMRVLHQISTVVVTFVCARFGSRQAANNENKKRFVFCSFVCSWRAKHKNTHKEQITTKTTKTFLVFLLQPLYICCFVAVTVIDHLQYQL